MKQINLKKYYPSLYQNDTFFMVSDTIANALAEEVKKENAQRAKILYHGAYYSFDKVGGLEVDTTALLEKNLENQELNAALYEAIIKLPEKQAKRVYARFVLGLSITALAKMEGVSIMAISTSIRKALENLKKGFKKDLFFY